MCSYTIIYTLYSERIRRSQTKISLFCAFLYEPIHRFPPKQAYLLTAVLVADFMIGCGRKFV